MPQLSQHLKNIIQQNEHFRSRCSLEDKSSPRLKPNDGTIIATQISPSISYYYTTKVFIKRQPHQDELGQDIYGNPATNPYIADRLRNEAAVLQFISENTTIPVPKFLDLWVEGGLVYLKTALVETGVELESIDKSLLPTAVEQVTIQLESTILPQLRQLHRKFMGSPNPKLQVIPPRRLWDWKEKRVWPSTVKDTPKYVFCHTDLDRQNILVDPVTYEIVSILDWETAGFFPQEWELPYWKANSRREKSDMSLHVKDRELATFQFS
jgi:hypothetical protein